MIFAVSFDSSDAAKSQGTKNSEINSDKVCGDKLCSEIDEPTEIEALQQGAVIKQIPNTSKKQMQTMNEKSFTK